MKVLTVGASPELLSAQGRLHADVLRALVDNGWDATCLAWSHDADYLSPGQPPEYKVNEVNIPVISMPAKIDPTTVVHMLVKEFAPDLIFTVGDLENFGFMKQIKMFFPYARWACVLIPYRLPISRSKKEILNFIDAILCSSSEGYDGLSDVVLDDCLGVAFAGADKCFRTLGEKPSGFRVMGIGKNTQTDNLPTLVEVAADMRRDIPELTLYLHVNQFDRGYYDFGEIQDRFDPRKEWLSFPDRYISAYDGYTNDELNELYNAAHLLVTVPMMAGTAKTCWESLSAGTPVLMPDYGIFQDVAHTNSLWQRGEQLVRCTKCMAFGEVYQWVCDHEDLRAKMEAFWRKRKQGYCPKLCNLKPNEFRIKVVATAEKAMNRQQTLSLET